jgi:acetylglutamate/LysW-gamma-L-alpha-aminoadipate kinase
MLLIKAGGGKSINWISLCRDIARFHAKEKMILIHGANQKRDEIAEKLNVPTKTVMSPSGVSSVYTDEAALDVFLMVYAGMVNKKIVAMLQQNGVNAAGVSGVDGLIWQAKHKKVILSREGSKTKLLRNNFSGKVEKADPKLIAVLVDNGFLPVLTPPALSFQNQIVNTDSDWAMAVLAEAMHIKTMVSLFEAPGLLKDPADEHSLIRKIKKQEIESVLKFGKGRMKKKILGAKRAIEGGVERIYWGDGRVENPLTNVLQRNGTVIE